MPRHAASRLMRGGHSVSRSLLTVAKCMPAPGKCQSCARPLAGHVGFPVASVGSAAKTLSVIWRRVCYNPGHQRYRSGASCLCPN